MRKGDIGAAVSDLQRQLIAAGIDTPVDGIYGDQTVAAVIRLQRRAGLVADGEAGPKTLAALLTRDADPRRLSQADIERAAARLGVSVAAVMAINAVESRGSGFLDNGRPVILFERHVLFHRLEAAGADAAAISARYPALVNPQRGGYVGGAAEWTRLAAARQITTDWPGLAEESCSWGAFQIMGYHWQALGYASCADFVAAMSRTEADQLEAFVRFLLAEAPLIKALKARKWVDFARLYNGPAYRENLYDAKLAAAFDRFAAAEVPA